MKLYRISQTENSEYDTYDAAVVVAATEEQARATLPDGGPFYCRREDVWADAKFVTVEYLGEAKDGLEAGVVVASYHAG